ncbi:MAG: hypothetical protein ACK4GN_12335 [Runella sp.]
MAQTSLAIPFEWIEKKLTVFFNHRFWRWRILALALTVSTGTLLVFNSVLVTRGFKSLYREMRSPGTEAGLFWDDIIKQGQDPFTPKDYKAGTHEANKTFRLTLPLLSHTLRLNVASLYLLHVLVGLVFLWFTTKIIQDILQNHVLTFYFMTGFTAIYAGSHFYLNWLGHADAFPFCFMLLSFYFRQPLLVFLFSQLGFWCDERALLNSSYIGLWYLWPLVDEWLEKRQIAAKKVPATVVVLLVSVMVYIALRQWLTTKYGLKVGHDNALSAQSLAWSLSIIGDKFTRGLEGFWLLIFAGLTAMILRKDTLKLLLLGGCLAVTWIVALMVADGTRALSYGFVGFFILLAYLKDHVPVHQIRLLLIVSALISLMLPISFP